MNTVKLKVKLGALTELPFEYHHPANISIFSVSENPRAPDGRQMEIWDKANGRFLAFLPKDLAKGDLLEVHNQLDSDGSHEKEYMEIISWDPTFLEVRPLTEQEFHLSLENQLLSKETGSNLPF